MWQTSLSRTLLSRSSILTKATPAIGGRLPSVCYFSDAATEKLRGIMEEYRKANFTQTIPSRFIKSVVNAADKNKDGMISIDEVEILLANIGVADQLSHEELVQVMQNFEGDEIPVERVQEVFLPQKKK